LISIFDEGRCEVAGLALLYVVMECARKILRRFFPPALTPDEARRRSIPFWTSLLTFMEKVRAWAYQADKYHG